MEHQTRIIKNEESVATFRAKAKKFYSRNIPINKLCKLCRTRDFFYSISIIIVVHMQVHFIFHIDSTYEKSVVRHT